MNRRNVLLGLGTVVTGGGAALGTGAFSSVEAQRSVSISVAEDSGALVGLAPNAQSNRVDTDADGALQIDLADANLKSKVTIDYAFEISNNSSDSFSLDADITDYGTQVSTTDDTPISELQVDTAVSLLVDTTAIAEADDGTKDLITEGPLEFASTDTNIECVLEIDTRNLDSVDWSTITGDDGSLVNDITFTATGPTN